MNMLSLDTGADKPEKEAIDTMSATQLKDDKSTTESKDDRSLKNEKGGKYPKGFKNRLSSLAHLVRQKYNSFVNSHPNAPALIGVVSKIAVVFFTVIVSKVSGNILSTTIAMVIAAIVLYIVQWSSMNNKKDNEKTIQMRICSSSYHHSREIENTENFYITAAGNRQIIDYLHKAADDIEFILTNHFRTPICCSIKYMTTEEQGYITVARGPNNIQNRGPNSTHIDSTEAIKVDDNSIVHHLVKSRSRYFVANDLKNLPANNKLKGFSCENEDWDKMFLSTFVLPICSTPVSVNEGGVGTQRLVFEEYGFIFVDSRRTEEWEKDIEKSLLYHCCSFYANQIGQLIQVGKKQSKT